MEVTDDDSKRIIKAVTEESRNKGFIIEFE